METLLALALFGVVTLAVYTWLWAHRSGRKYPKVIGWKNGEPHKWLMPNGDTWERIE